MSSWHQLQMSLWGFRNMCNILTTSAVQCLICDLHCISVLTFGCFDLFSASFCTTLLSAGMVTSVKRNFFPFFCFFLFLIMTLICLQSPHCLCVCISIFWLVSCNSFLVPSLVLCRNHISPVGIPICLWPEWCKCVLVVVLFYG